MPAEGPPDPRPTGLTPEKREDIWALIIAAAVLLICLIAPEEVHDFFKRIIYLF